MTTPTTTPTMRTAGARARTLPTVGRIADPELRRFVGELTDVARLELARAGRRRPARIKRTKEISALAERVGVDLDSDRPIVQQLDLRKVMPVGRALAERPVPSPAAVAPPPRAGAATNRGVRFMVRSVTCDDETDPEPIGRDDIALAGLAINVDGTTRVIEERFIGKFNDRDKVTFDPPLELANVALTNATFPAVAGVVVALSEKDLGGFSTFLETTFADLKGVIKVVFDGLSGALGLAIGAKLGAELGAEVGALVGGAIGTIVGLLAGLVLGAVIGGIVAVAKDDIFVPSTTTVSLDAPDATFADGTATSDVALGFAGFGGRYTVTGRWSLVR